MIPELIVHSALQVIIISIYFWAYLAPYIQAIVNNAMISMVTTPIENAMRKNCAVNIMIKKQLKDKDALYIGTDPVLSRTNTILLVSNVVIVFLLSCIALFLIFKYYWNIHSAYAVLEVVLTYTVVIGIQMWFTVAIKEYNPFTREEMTELLYGAASRYCVV
jgi:hypothetical protein